MVFLEKPADFDPKMEVVSCFIDCGGEFLSIKRSPHRPQGNTWCLPSGKIENGESLQAAMIREIQEEVGIAAESGRLSHFKKMYIRYPDFDFIFHIFSYLVDTRPDVTLSEEHTEYRWLKPLEALKLDLIPDEDVSIKLFYKLG